MWSYLLCMIVISSAAQNIYDVTTAGAVGDGKTDDAQAIQRMIDRCSAEGGGRVLLPRNHVFMAGPLELKSNVELYLEATATLKAHPDESIYHLSAFGPTMLRTSVLRARAPFMVTASLSWGRNWKTVMS